MHTSKIKISAAIISLIVALNTGCEEKNSPPTIQFLQPKSNLIIDGDTILSIVADPHDQDGTIDRVEFSINQTVVETKTDPPYSFDWHVTTEDNIGANLINAVAYDDDGAKGEDGISVEIRSYLTKWLGTYEGTSHHWSSYPIEISGQYQMVTNSSDKNIEVKVIMGSQDSCLTFEYAYNDTARSTREDIYFSKPGIHYSQWGGGSGYGYLRIMFDSDTLKYHYFQKCGIPCSSGIEFMIRKKKM